jgi:hypothetical protein
MQKSIVLLLILLPFVYSKYSFSPFEIPKTWVIGLVALFSVGYYIYQQRLKLPETGRSRILVALVVLWGLLIFSSLVNGNFWQSWAGNYYRADGLLTLTAMIVIGLCLNRTFVVAGDWMGSITMSFLTIWYGGETALRMGNPNFLAGYLAVTLPMTAGLGVFWVIPQLVVIILLKSWGGALVGLLFIVVALLRQNSKLMVITMLLVCVGFGWLYTTNQVQQNPQRLVMAEGRERIWRKAAIAIGQKPFVGWGGHNLAGHLNRLIGRFITRQMRTLIAPMRV